MSDRRRHALTVFVTLVTALLSGLALGALWALLAASLVDQAVWLAWGAAAGMALTMRFTSPRPGWFAAVLAALGTVLAACYAECLQLLLRISAQFGLPLLEAIHTSGIISTSKLAWRLLPTEHMVVYAAAALLAFIITLWPRFRTRSDT